MAGRGNRTLFYATAEDLLPRLAMMEDVLSIKYVESGVFVTSSPIIYDSYLAIHNLGCSSKGDTILDPAYLVVPRQASIRHQAFKPNSGEVRFAIDQSENPLSVIFSPGGVFLPGKAVIQGSISKLTKTPECDELYRAVVKAVTRGMSKLKGHSLGEHALELSKKGFRLTASVRGNPAYDLRP